MKMKVRNQLRANFDCAKILPIISQNRSARSFFQNGTSIRPCNIIYVSIINAGIRNFFSFGDSGFLSCMKDKHNYPDKADQPKKSRIKPKFHKNIMRVKPLFFVRFSAKNFLGTRDII